MSISLSYSDLKLNESNLKNKDGSSELIYHKVVFDNNDKLQGVHRKSLEIISSSSTTLTSNYVSTENHVDDSNQKEMSLKTDLKNKMNDQLKHIFSSMTTIWIKLWKKEKQVMLVIIRALP